jgi:uncharacterized membrane protein YhaH (DUF805 family)
MKKYYYSNGVDRKGPVTLEELKSSADLRHDTLVWYEGLTGWVRADELEELSEVFVSIPPINPRTEGNTDVVLSDIFVGAAPPPVPPPVPPAVDASPASSASEDTPQRLERSMFLHSFSFRGRIRRLEYILSVMITVSAFWLMSAIYDFVSGFIIGYNLYHLFSDQDFSSLSYTMKSAPMLLVIYLILIIIVLRFLFAQGAKRSHDIGLSGWWQLMPLYDIVLIFFEGTKGTNKDGPDPRPSSSGENK